MCANVADLSAVYCMQVEFSVLIFVQISAHIHELQTKTHIFANVNLASHKNHLAMQLLPKHSGHFVHQSFAGGFSTPTTPLR